MAGDRSLESLTFREKIRDETHLLRDLVEHVEQSFLPRLARLEAQLTPRPGHTDEDIADISIRNLVNQVLESETFGSALDSRIEALGQAIVRDSHRILNPGAS